MSGFVLEPLGRDHDREGFDSGLASVDEYLRRTARGHGKKEISRTRVLVPDGAEPPKPIAGFVTLTQVAVDARAWTGSPKGLPSTPTPAILLGRMAVAKSMQGKGLSRMLVSSALQLALDASEACGGLGLLVDAASEDLIGFYEKFGFRRIAEGSLRMFLPTQKLRLVTKIPRC
jgi:GNAT superfamily N-acetyltransferase